MLSEIELCTLLIDFFTRNRRLGFIFFSLRQVLFRGKTKIVRDDNDFYLYNICGFGPRQIKPENKISICCFSPKHAT